jgi:hypothetical protein
MKLNNTVWSAEFVDMRADEIYNIFTTVLRRANNLFPSNNLLHDLTIMAHTTAKTS